MINKLNLIRRKIDYYLEILASHIADAIVTEAISIRYEIRPRRVCPNKLLFGARFIDLNLFKKMKNIDSRENIIGFIGRLEYDKGILDFLMSITYINKNINNTEKKCTFYIIGTGSLFNLVKRISNKLRNKNLDIKVLGYVEHERIPIILNEMKLLVIPYYSHLEGIPTVILEAMACGTPVIARATGLIPSIIRNGVTGILLPYEASTKDFARVIVDILQNPHILLRISNNCVRIIHKYFSFEAAIHRYLKIFHNIIESST